MESKIKFKAILIFSLTFIFFNTVEAQKNINYRWNKMLKEYVSVNGNVMLKLTSQKFLISLFVPGSCPPNWFDGIPITINPLSL